jgi:hypothetical protein
MTLAGVNIFATVHLSLQLGGTNYCLCFLAYFPKIKIGLSNN